MATYISVLPQVFPYYITASSLHIRQYVSLLLEHNSSFAVTAGPRNESVLWLSQASMDWIAKSSGLDVGVQR